jgi:hypothetical protein
MSIDGYGLATLSACGVSDDALRHIEYLQDVLSVRCANDIDNAIKFHSRAKDFSYPEHAAAALDKASQILDIMKELFSEKKQLEWRTRFDALRHESEPKIDDNTVSSSSSSLPHVSRRRPSVLRFFSLFVSFLWTTQPVTRCLG